MLVSKKTVDGTPISDLSQGSEKKVKVRCNHCKRTSTTTFSNYIRSQGRRGNPGTTFCRACASKTSAFARRGKPAHNKGKRLLPEEKGKNHPSWKGGRFIDAHGYVMIHTGGPRGSIGWNAYRKEHVLVVEKDIGRKLEKDETVHHIDGDKLRNVIQNLWLTDHQGHRLAHQSLQEIGYSLVRAGLVTFDRTTGEYQVAHHKLRELLEHPGGDNQQPS